MPFRDLGFNFTYYYFINSLVCDGKGTAILPRFQKLRRNLPRVVATGWERNDISGLKGKILSFFQQNRRKVAFIKA